MRFSKKLTAKLTEDKLSMVLEDAGRSTDYLESKYDSYGEYPVEELGGLKGWMSDAVLMKTLLGYWDWVARRLLLAAEEVQFGLNAGKRTAAHHKGDS